MLPGLGGVLCQTKIHMRANPSQLIWATVGSSSKRGDACQATAYKSSFRNEILSEEPRRTTAPLS